MLVNLGLHSAEFSAVYKDPQLIDRPCFNLPKRETLILVSGYDVQMRARIIDRFERLAESGVIGTLATQEFMHNGNSYTEYMLCKRDSLILVAQNSPEFTAKIVDRWQELETIKARQRKTINGNSARQGCNLLNTVCGNLA